MIAGNITDAMINTNTISASKLANNATVASRYKVYCGDGSWRQIGTNLDYDDATGNSITQPGLFYFMNNLSPNYDTYTFKFHA